MTAHPHTHTHAQEGTIKDGKAAAEAISKLEGVVDHGLFLDMVDVCIVAASAGIQVLNKA